MNQLAQLVLPGMDKNDPINSPTGFKFTTIGEILSASIPLLFAFAGVGLLFMIIFSGFTLMTSAGDAKKTEQGKQRLTFAIVGFLVIFLSYWLVQIIGHMFGIDAITSMFGG